MGASLGAILVFQLECMVILALAYNMYSIGDFFSWDGIKYLADLIAISLFLIIILGHMKAAVAVFRDFNDPTVVEKNTYDPKSLKEALNFFKNPVTQGALWRIKREWPFLKEIANLNFKYKD